MRENPIKYAKEAEFKQAKNAKVGWTISKILFVNGMQGYETAVINDDLIKKMSGK
jgi:hypothetical protein